MCNRYLVDARIKTSESDEIRFNERGILDSVEFKILNLNHKYEWKQVSISIGCE